MTQQAQNNYLATFTTKLSKSEIHSVVLSEPLFPFHFY